MSFPFDYSGEISGEGILASNVESFQRTFMRKAQERLERAKASIVIRDGEISFSNAPKLSSMFSMDSALLGSIPRGKLILNRQEGTITYYLNFRRLIIILSLLVWGIFGSFFIFAVHGSLLLRIGIVVFGWLLMVIGSTLTGIHRFKQFINRILREMDVRLT